ncbi:uncharacterized protein [Branchiostoma lanceolatum]|uniref:uncharacterized protein n=1 Tax=Branchiostoma lanceolatum TaxID=7740 RepID=UPI00345357AD
MADLQTCLSVLSTTKKMADLKVVTVAVLAIALIATGQSRQREVKHSDAEAPDLEELNEDLEEMNNLFNELEMLNKMLDEMEMSPEEDDQHTSETTSGGEATEEETESVDTAVPQEAVSDKCHIHEKHSKTLQRVKRLRRSLLRKRGVKEWFCDKLLDSSEERPRGKRGVRDRLWMVFCIPGPASASSASSSSEERRLPKLG